MCTTSVEDDWLLLRFKRDGEVKSARSTTSTGCRQQNLHQLPQAALEYRCTYRSLLFQRERHALDDTSMFWGIQPRLPQKWQKGFLRLLWMQRALSLSSLKWIRTPTGLETLLYCGARLEKANLCAALSIPSLTTHRFIFQRLLALLMGRLSEFRWARFVYFGLCW